MKCIQLSSPTIQLSCCNQHKKCHPFILYIISFWGYDNLKLVDFPEISKINWRNKNGDKLAAKGWCEKIHPNAFQHDIGTMGKKIENIRSDLETKNKNNINCCDSLWLPRRSLGIYLLWMAMYVIAYLFRHRILKVALNGLRSVRQFE